MLRIYKSHLSRTQYSYKKPFVLTINVVYRRIIKRSQIAYCKPMVYKYKSLNFTTEKTVICINLFIIMATITRNADYQYKLNTDLSEVDWQRILDLFKAVEWKYRKAGEIEGAFRNSTATIFVYHNELIIAFGRVVGDGRYYAMIADIVVDPDYQGQGLGKYLV